MKKAIHKKSKKHYFNRGDSQRYTHYFTSEQHSHFFFSSGMLIRIPLIIFPLMLLIMTISAVEQRDVIADFLKVISHISIPPIHFPGFEIAFKLP